MLKRITALTAVMALWCAAAAWGQTAVAVGKGSYASFPPTYKASTPDHNGFNATRVEGKRLYADERKNQPLPTNDWWTDVINSRYSGALWSLPQMLHTSEAGVTVNYPTRWNDNGTEVLPTSSIRVGGRNFAADATVAREWGDWHVVMRMPSADNSAELTVTMAHGMPFTWIETEGLSPELTFSATPRFFDIEGNSGTRPRGTTLGCVIGDDLYGIYLPDGAVAGWADGRMTVSGETGWLVIALLNTPHDLEAYRRYATSVPRSTAVSWSYDEDRALINTRWRVDAENLARPGADAPVLQGFLPHAYKTGRREFAFDGHEYLTPRGTLKLAASQTAGTSHTFAYAYRFDGMMPYYAAPAENNAAANPYNAARMKALVDNYAANGAFGDDTYWGGKGLTQMALNMTFAKETGNTAAYETSRRKLRDKLTDWLTYTPGEDRCFFAYYPRWGALVGFDPSYDSDSFNDHHFHYGYFIYAGALLCLEDEEFRRDYGPMLKSIAKDYANYDRADTRFPFLRTLDPWAGHSYAGGLGDAGNDNGNGQESSSEAMQSWGALYLLGVALSDNEMRDAGIFGYMTESNGVAEYWFDRDQIHPGRQHNYDYTKYSSPYCTNLTSKGIGWWTWFSGDPLWMHSIQWMPVSPCLNYLSKDLEFVKWDYDKMMQSTAYQWFTGGGDTPPLASQSVGNVVLAYMERANPDLAAGIFDKAYDGNFPLAKATDTGHISYYLIQSHRTYGDLDFGVWADCPTANAYRKADGSMTYMVYNPGSAERTVRFYRGETLEKTVKAPAGMTAFTDSPSATSIETETEAIVPPGTSRRIEARVVDQYGASVDGAAVTWSLSADAPATVSSDGTLLVSKTARKGSRFTLTAASGKLSAAIDVKVNDLPVAAQASITPIVNYSETGQPLSFEIECTDQYGHTFDPSEATWRITAADGGVVSENPSFTPVKPGIHTVTAIVAGKAFSTQVNITPPMNDIGRHAAAIASSEENVGTPTAAVNDGDASTRWGSIHTDDQWVMLDLGEEAYISRVAVNWEAAYASDYEIQTAPAGATMTDFTGTYAGAQRKVRVPAESEWSVAAVVSGNSGPGTVTSAVGSRGRYVRMRGIRRGSDYGYSIYEMSVYGIPASTAPDDIIGLDIDVPSVMDQNETATLSARSYTLSGQSAEAEVTWSADREAAFEGNRFTPTGYGSYTVTATAPGGVTADTHVMVSEAARTASIAINPAVTAMLAGDRRRFDVTALDQFGAVRPVDASTLRAVVRDASGRPADASTAAFSLATMTFCPNIAGDYVIDFNEGLGRATVAVRDITEANLAVGHPATASATVGGNTASMANDADPATRWESPAADGHWIGIDLEDLYMINRVAVVWEGAYASDYRIMTSVDGETWAVADAVSGHSGAGRAEHTFAECPARYVRLICDRRGTVYGNSLYELEVYGTSRINPDDTGEAPEITGFTLEPGNGTATLRGTATHPQGHVTATFAVTRRESGRTVASESLNAVSGTGVEATLGGLYRGVDYVAVMTAADLFGNTSRATIEFTGEYSIDGINLALGKDAAASSHENAGLTAGNAVDGDLSTRWGSEFNDGEWIKVDLGQIYPVCRIAIDWNVAAHATDYDVMLALDDTDGIDNDTADTAEYTTVDHVALSRASAETVPESPVMARYVKIRGNRRANQYGTSIDELRVYGDDSLYDPEIPADDPAQSEIDDWKQWDQWDKWGEPAVPENPGTVTLDVPPHNDRETLVDVWTLQGTPVLRRVKRDTAMRHLLPGIYVVGGEKVMVK